MASPKELVEVVSDQMGVQIETVTVIDRWLADAGLRTRALRGRGNTPMTYQDAANLIIATAWNANPKDAVRVVNEYGGLPVTRGRPSDGSNLEKEFLGETFGDALANMIESVQSERAAFSANSDHPGAMSAEVIMYGIHPTAEIVVNKGSEIFTFKYGEWSRSGDLKRIVKFSQITLGFVGEAIAKDLLNT